MSPLNCIISGLDISSFLINNTFCSHHYIVNISTNQSINHSWLSPFSSFVTFLMELRLWLFFVLSPTYFILQMELTYLHFWLSPFSSFVTFLTDLRLFSFKYNILYIVGVTLNVSSTILDASEVVRLSANVLPGYDNLVTYYRWKLGTDSPSIIKEPYIQRKLNAGRWVLWHVDLFCVIFLPTQIFHPDH